MDSVSPFVKGIEILPDGSVARTGTNYSGRFQEAHDASKASIQSRISNLESGGVKGTGETVKKIGDINDPIRTYRGADLGKLEAKYTADPRLTVKMP
ncbi:hypothetical protein ABH948_001503 [Bacillus sp. RC218]